MIASYGGVSDYTIGSSAPLSKVEFSEAVTNSESIPADPMCEAKMDPESADGDKVVETEPINNNKMPSKMKGRPPPIVMSPHSQDEEEEDEDMSSDNDLISVGGSPSPSSPDTNSRTHLDDCPTGEVDEYFRPLKKLRMLQVGLFVKYDVFNSRLHAK